MKHLLLTALAAIVCIASLAQTEGVVTYEETIKITMEVPPEFRDMIPKERRQKKTLTFTATESLYKNVPQETTAASEIQAQSSTGGMQIRFQGMNQDNQTYKNLQEGTVIEKQQFFGRDFLISGEEKINWKMTGEQKKIGDYVCMKATYMRDTIPVSAWFTPQIPISNGPGSIGQLPGLVLEVDVNNGMVVITATDVALRPLTPEEAIVVPDKGKTVTREEFNKIRDEKMKEMQEMDGPGGQRFIMRGN